MPQTLVQRGRVTVWKTGIGARGVGVLAYAAMATDHRSFGDTAVIATVVGLDGAGADLWTWATSNHSGYDEDVLARWLICQRWSARLTSSPSRRDFFDVEWTVQVERRCTLKNSSYGHESLALGQLRFAEPLHDPFSGGQAG